MTLDGAEQCANVSRAGRDGAAGLSLAQPWQEEEEEELAAAAKEGKNIKVSTATNCYWGFREGCAISPALIHTNTQTTLTQTTHTHTRTHTHSTTHAHLALRAEQKEAPAKRGGFAPFQLKFPPQEEVEAATWWEWEEKEGEKEGMTQAEES